MCKAQNRPGTGAVAFGDRAVSSPLRASATDVSACIGHRLVRPNAGAHEVCLQGRQWIRSGIRVRAFPSAADGMAFLLQPRPPLIAGASTASEQAREQYI